MASCCITSNMHNSCPWLTVSCKLSSCLPLHLISYNPVFAEATWVTPASWTQLKLFPTWGLHSYCFLCFDHPFLCSFFAWWAAGLGSPSSLLFHDGLLCPPYLHRPPPLQELGRCHFNLSFALIRLFSVCNNVPVGLFSYFLSVSLIRPDTPWGQCLGRLHWALYTLPKYRPGSQESPYGQECSEQIPCIMVIPLSAGNVSVFLAPSWVSNT